MFWQNRVEFKRVESGGKVISHIFGPSPNHPKRQKMRVLTVDFDSILGSAKGRTRTEESDLRVVLNEHSLVLVRKEQQKSRASWTALAKPPPRALPCCKWGAGGAVAPLDLAGEMQGTEKPTHQKSKKVLKNGRGVQRSHTSGFNWTPKLPQKIALLLKIEKYLSV